MSRIGNILSELIIDVLPFLPPRAMGALEKQGMFFMYQIAVKRKAELARIDGLGALSQRQIFFELNDLNIKPGSVSLKKDTIEIEQIKLPKSYLEWKRDRKNLWLGSQNLAEIKRQIKSIYPEYNIDIRIEQIPGLSRKEKAIATEVALAVARRLEKKPIASEVDIDSDFVAAVLEENPNIVKPMIDALVGELRQTREKTYG